GNRIPFDSPDWTIQNLMINRDGIAITLYILSIIGIVLAVLLIILNFIFRKDPIIKASSPCLNCVELLGVICIYAFVILSLDIPSTLQCYLKPFIISLGIGLLLG